MLLSLETESSRNGRTGAILQRYQEGDRNENLNEKQDEADAVVGAIAGRLAPGSFYTLDGGRGSVRGPSLGGISIAANPNLGFFLSGWNTVLRQKFSASSVVLSLIQMLRDRWPRRARVLSRRARAFCCCDLSGAANGATRRSLREFGFHREQWSSERPGCRSQRYTATFRMRSQSCDAFCFSPELVLP